MLGPWPNRGIDHSTAACVWRESDPWFIVYMHNNIYIYTTDYNRIIPHRSGDVPHITGGITHLLSGMRPKVVSAWCPLMIDCHQSPGHMTRFIPWKPALGLGPCKQRLHRGPCWQVPSVFFWPCHLWRLSKAWLLVVEKLQNQMRHQRIHHYAGCQADKQRIEWMLDAD